MKRFTLEPKVHHTSSNDSTDLSDDDQCNKKGNNKAEFKKVKITSGDGGEQQFNELRVTFLEGGDGKELSP